ncbi:MAG: ATP-binding cassette domain-containing protein, partial [Clostridiales bacterium]|nr:ATP-binding cassette domain-containing protein [Clostridiales bacterium]
MNEKEKRTPILQVNNLHVSFGKGRHHFEAVNGVSFNVYPGETFGLVGESGSGKTTIGRTIVRVYPVKKGEIYFEGRPIHGRLSKQEDKAVTQNIQMIFQDPMA